MPHQDDDRNRNEREGHLGQSGNDMNSPTGTSGRERRQHWQGGSEDSRQSEDRRRRPARDDEESSLGNRNTNR